MRVSERHGREEWRPGLGDSWIEERASAAPPELPRPRTGSGGGQAGVRTGKRPYSSCAGRWPGGADQALGGWAESDRAGASPCPATPRDARPRSPILPQPARVALVAGGRFLPPDACSSGAPGSRGASGFPVRGVLVPRSLCGADARRYYGVTVVLSGCSFGDRAGLGRQGGMDAVAVAPTGLNPWRPPALASWSRPGAAASARPRPAGARAPTPEFQPSIDSRIWPCCP
ncbi:uncharacterized protein LOC110345024 [Heterocephalus glaber]|uniref:Uncharacterized protein LOC110345024 n=1 Tax=Heterocephalus glaber TaxID=10181 RepID=A0AAX6RIQ5_HETGA|nr:uncharacterized protein LOC110345024 [Heterocephalus glaber]